MTAKEMQRRNGKAQQLRVIQVEEGHYFVESSDGKVAYKAMLTDEKTYCTCLDYQKNQQDPNFRCKHMMAIEACLPDGSAQQKDFLKRRQPRLDERFIKNIEGKDFVLYAGLLDLAHQKGLASMEVEILQFPSKENGNMAIIKAFAESKLGESFSDVGDANPENCNFKVAKHLLRMASTRAKARALRDFTNIGLTALEELGDLNEIIEEGSVHGKGKPETGPAKKGQADKAKPEAKPVPAAAAAPVTQPVGKASEAQKRAIHNLSRRRGLSLEDLRSWPWRPTAPISVSCPPWMLPR